MKVSVCDRCFRKKEKNRKRKELKSIYGMTEEEINIQESQLAATKKMTDEDWIAFYESQKE